MPWDADDAYLLSLNFDRVVTELDGAIRFPVHELLKAGVVEMVRDSRYDASTTFDVADAEENVSVVTAEGVGERKDVFDDLALLVVIGAGEGVLGFLEVESVTLVFPE